jgi:branched-chain amino acid transport system substrate-binding protein
MRHGWGTHGAGALCATAAAVVGLLSLAAPAGAAEPIRIGVIAEAQAVAAASIPQAAQMAADEINAKGGINGRKIEIVTYDDHSSASDAVRAFQRAVTQDHVNAVIASYISEVALALEPWAARLHMPFITPGASSDQITKNVHDNYDRYKYVFHGYLTSTALARSVCDGVKATLVKEYHLKSAVIMSEDAAWTRPLDASYENCLPKIGLKVLDHVRFSPDTTDFTPIFNQFENEKPDLIVTGLSHAALQPVVQWKNQQVPIAQAGINSQATNGTFWKETNGATQGVLYQAVSTDDVAMTPKTVPFAQNFKKRFGNFPSYCGYSAYDAVYYIGDAIRRAKSTDPDKMVAALEKTDWVGTIGHIQFYGKNEKFTHGLKYGEGYITGLLLQWQDGKQVAVWPEKVASAKVKLPSFVKIASPAK